MGPVTRGRCAKCWPKTPDLAATRRFTRGRSWCCGGILRARTESPRRRRRPEFSVARILHNIIVMRYASQDEERPYGVLCPLLAKGVQHANRQAFRLGR